MSTPPHGWASHAMVPALLTMAHYVGTLAAARCLGARGVPVFVATDRVFGPAAWSRAVTRRMPCPSVDLGPGVMLEWLLSFGARQPGAVLYPTSDEFAWLISRHLDSLGKVFRLYSPGVATLSAVLDKIRLYDACRAVGLDIPRTWLPRDEGAVRDVAGQGPAFVVKPRTQAFFARHAKGRVARNPEALVSAWREYYAPDYAPEFGAELPDLQFPVVQEYLSGAEEGVCSVSGFVDRSGTLLVALGSLKVFQRPSSVGIGLCFESIDPPAGIEEKLSALCAHLGYFGVFEAEFVRAGDRWLLIDFNPRYFGQMGFDIARGAPLPWLCHLAALGDEEGARRATGQVPASGTPRAYRDTAGLLWHLGTEGAAGVVGVADVRRWSKWLRDHDGNAMDAAFESRDPLPAFAAAAGTLWHSIRHPRGFLRSLKKDT